MSLKQQVNSFFKNHPYYSAALLGGTFTLGFAPFLLWPLAMLALGLFYVLVQKENSFKKLIKISLLFGFAHHLTGVHWVARSFYVDFGSWWIAGPIGAVAMSALAFYMAFYIVATVWLYKKMPQKLQNPLSFTFLWVLFEFLRSQLPDVFPWNLAGYVWVDALPLLQLASLGEIWLMSFVFVLITCLFFWQKKRYASVFVAVVVLASCWGWGSYRLAHAQLKEIGLSVHMVQANIPQTEKWNSDLRMGHLKQYVELSQSSTPADVLLWPEMSILYDITRNDRLRTELVSAVNAKSFILGGLRVEKDDQTVAGYNAYNGAFLLNNKAEIVQEFDKQKLLPYGEYVPFRSYLPGFVQNILGKRMDYKPGFSDRLMPVSGEKKAVILICGESAIPSLAKGDYLEADFIINITNDAWFDFTIGPHQHFQMSRVRAVSAGLPVLRVANTGRTAVVDRYGRIVKRLEINHQGVLKLDRSTRL